MGVLDKLNERFKEIEESGIDFGPVSGNIVVAANSVTEFESIDDDGDALTAGLEAEEITLIEVTLGVQERGKQGAKTGEWQLVMETGFALPKARLGVIEDGEFQPLPIYENPFYQGILNQTPLVYGQLLKAQFVINEDAPTPEQRVQPGPALEEFKALLDEAGYIPRQTRENSQFTRKRDVLWSVEPANPQSGPLGFATDLPFRIKNGLTVENFTIVPPRRLDGNALDAADKVDLLERGKFVDLFSSWIANLERVASGLAAAETVEEKRAARRLASCLTGASNETGPLYSSRATIPQFAVSSGHFEQQGRNRIWVPDDPRAFSFWATREASVSETQ